MKESLFIHVPRTPVLTCYRIEEVELCMNANQTPDKYHQLQHSEFWSFSDNNKLFVVSVCIPIP